MIGYRILSDFSILASLSSISPSSQFPSVVRIRIRVINTRLYWPISVAGNTLSWIQRKIEFRDRGLFWINESHVIDVTCPFVKLDFSCEIFFFPSHSFYLHPNSIIARCISRFLWLELFLANIFSFLSFFFFFPQSFTIVSKYKFWRN